MVGKNDLGAKADEPKPVSPDKPIIIQPQEEKIKKPLVIEPEERKPSHAKPVEEAKIKKPSLIEPDEAKIKKPLVIEPDEPKPVQVKPGMAELKGEPGKKTAGVKKPKKAVVQEESRVVTLMLFLSLIFLAGGLVFLAFPIFNKPLPGWLEPVMSFFRKLPFFPE